MSFKTVCLALGAVVVSLSASRIAAGEIVDFEDLTLDTRYFADNVFVSGGVTLTVSSLAGHIDVQNLGDAGGSGNELEFFGGSAGGTSLDFDFGGDVENVSLLYGAYGGDLNLTVNGDGVVVGSFTTLPATLGGVGITQTGDAFGLGTLSFDGVISSFAIGGQEFVLDDVSYQLIPAPGAAALLAIGLAGVAARRRHRGQRGG